VGQENSIRNPLDNGLHAERENGGGYRGDLSRMRLKTLEIKQKGGKKREDARNHHRIEKGISMKSAKIGRRSG